MAEPANILSIEALKHLLEDLFEVRAKWYNIGLQLGVPAGTLDSIRSADDGASLREMLKRWLRQGEPPATGLALINALSSRTVGEGQLARYLATREYLKPTVVPRRASCAEKVPVRKPSVSTVSAENLVQARQSVSTVGSEATLCEEDAVEGAPLHKKPGRITQLEQHLETVQESVHKLLIRKDQDHNGSGEGLFYSTEDTQKMMEHLTLAKPEDTVRETDSRNQAASEKRKPYEKWESVTFMDISSTYPPKENLSLTYRCDPGLQPMNRDWVGLFRVGWTTSRDYYTFEWAPTPSDDKREGSVTFAGQRLPPKDGHFYQVCYVSRDGTIRGYSTPFQFMTLFELVEVSEEGLMLVPRTKSYGEVKWQQEQCEEACVELSSIQMSFSVLQSEKATLVEQLEVVENENGAPESMVKERDVQVGELEHQLQTIRESEQKLMVKLEKERAQNRELHEQLQQRVDRSAYKALQVAYENMEHYYHKAAQNRELHEQLQQSEQPSGPANTVDRSAYEALQVAYENMEHYYHKAAQNRELHEQLQQSEQPSGPANTVDRSAYEALQVAYENMEDYYHKAEQEKENVCMQLQQSQEVVQTLEDKCDELMARIERARKEFESKAEGNVQLCERVRELEERQNQMADNCAAAVRELSARGKECKALEAQLAQVQHEFDALQQKHNEKLHAKNEALERQQAVQDAKLAELSVAQERGAELERELKRAARDKTKTEKVKELRGQIEKLKVCPVCETKFPARFVQSEFERHVQAHFQD